MIPLPKKGNTNKYNNNRTMSLIKHSSKVLLNITLARMKSTAQEIINEAQAGFTEGSGTVEQISNVRIINEKYKNTSNTSATISLISKKLSTERGMKHYGKQCSNIT